jgi:hypothetical protein
MLYVEQKTHAPVINAPTHVVTPSAGFGRSFARRLVKAKLTATRREELLHGVAAEGAIFERYDDFDSMARDAADRRPRSK